MSLPARSLGDGEVVVVEVGSHGWALLRPVGLAIAVVVGAGFAASVSVARPVAWALVGLVVLAVVNLLARYLRWRARRLVVTTERVVLRSGVLSRSGREIPLSKVTEVSYRQSLPERLVRVGELRIECADRDGAEVFPDVSRPAALQATITRLLTERQAPPGERLSLPEQLDRLDALRQRGVLTAAELDAAKSRLLGR
ncbi:MAG: PH domain-containing protein [Actinomycetota bacterium]|nr:PH domain-containing protein [Actinomycetota bacterium]